MERRGIATGPGLMSHVVFISYSSKDQATADLVTQALEASGYRCWMANRDIIPGQGWAEAIIAAIDSCKVLVLVFSASSNTSHQVLREVDGAVNRQIPMVALRIDDVRPSNALEYYISAHHWLDASKPPFETHLRYLTQVIGGLLNREEPPPPPPPPPARTHPWRRLGARLLDLFLADRLLMLLFLISLPANAPMTKSNVDAIISSPAFDLFFGICAIVLLIPIDAWLLSRFGTTFGGLIHGISLEAGRDGTRLRIGAMAYRGLRQAPIALAAVILTCGASIAGLVAGVRAHSVWLGAAVQLAGLVAAGVLIWRTFLRPLRQQGTAPWDRRGPWVPAARRMGWIRWLLLAVCWVLVLGGSGALASVFLERHFSNQVPELSLTTDPVPVPSGSPIPRILPRAERSGSPAQTSSDPVALRADGAAAYARMDYGEARQAFAVAAEAGDTDAQRDLGWLYQNGWGVDQSYNEALRWYLKAAAKGDAVAQTRIGALYQNGWGVGKDYAEAPAVLITNESHSRSGSDLSVSARHGQCAADRV